MSSTGHAASSMLTPMSRFHTPPNSGLSPAKHAQELGNLRLNFNNIVGTTTASANAFDALPEHHTFVSCAGPAAVLSRVDDHLNITQQLYRARPNASPVNATQSFYNPATPPNTPGKSRHGSPLKDGGCGTIYNGLQDYPPNSPSQGRANNRIRETSCVSLSRGGNLLAVGEVNWPASKFVTSINKYRRDIIQGFLYTLRCLIVHRMSHYLSLAIIASGSPPSRFLMTPVGSVLLEITMTVSYLFIQSMRRPGRLGYTPVTSAVMCIELYGWGTV